MPLINAEGTKFPKFNSSHEHDITFKHFPCADITGRPVYSGQTCNLNKKYSTQFCEAWIYLCFNVNIFLCNKNKWI